MKAQTPPIEGKQVFVKINGERLCPWRGIDNEGEILASFGTMKRNKSAALVLLK